MKKIVINFLLFVLDKICPICSRLIRKNDLQKKGFDVRYPFFRFLFKQHTMALKDTNGNIVFVNKNYKRLKEQPFEKIKIGYQIGLKFIKMKYYFVAKDSKWGLVNKSGDILIPVEYDDIRYFNENQFRVQLNEKWGLIGTDNQIIIEPQYDFIGNIANDDNSVIVRINGEISWINKFGQKNK